MSKTHRENNLDNANIDKALRAAEQQIRSIERIQRQKGLAFLSPKLQEIGTGSSRSSGTWDRRTGEADESTAF